MYFFVPQCWMLLSCGIKITNTKFTDFMFKMLTYCEQIFHLHTKLCIMEPTTNPQCLKQNKTLLSFLFLHTTTPHVKCFWIQTPWYRRLYYRIFKAIYTFPKLWQKFLLKKISINGFDRNIKVHTERRATICLMHWNCSTSQYIFRTRTRVILLVCYFLVDSLLG